MRRELVFFARRPAATTFGFGAVRLDLVAVFLARPDAFGITGAGGFFARVDFLVVFFALTDAEAVVLGFARLSLAGRAVALRGVLEAVWRPLL